jgi:hypothetical protein
LLVALIVAVPGARAMTIPPATVAMAVSLDSHSTAMSVRTLSL